MKRSLEKICCSVERVSRLTSIEGYKLTLIVIQRTTLKFTKGRTNRDDLKVTKAEMASSAVQILNSVC